MPPLRFVLRPNPFTVRELCRVRKGNAYTVAARRSRAGEWGRNAFFLGVEALPWWGEGRRALVDGILLSLKAVSLLERRARLGLLLLLLLGFAGACGVKSKPLPPATQQLTSSDSQGPLSPGR